MVRQGRKQPGNHSMSASKPTPEQRERAAYLGERIAALQTEIQQLKVEKAQIAEQLRGMDDRTSPEAKKLKLRRAYVAKRPEEAKAELTALAAERRAISGKPA